LKLGSESLQGNITTSSIGTYALRIDETTNSYTSSGVDNSAVSAVRVVRVREALNIENFHIPCPFPAVAFARSVASPPKSYNIKAGNYTGNITWNLVAGPSI
jgi:hypothetical protein